MIVNSLTNNTTLTNNTALTDNTALNNNTALTINQRMDQSNLSDKINNKFFNQIYHQYELLFFFSVCIKLMYIIFLVTIISLCISIISVGFISLFLDFFTNVEKTIRNTDQQITSNNDIRVYLFCYKLYYLIFPIIVVMLLFVLQQYLEKKCLTILENNSLSYFIKRLNEADIAKCKSLGFDKISNFLKTLLILYHKKKQNIASIAFLTFFWIFSYIFTLYGDVYINYSALKKLNNIINNLDNSKAFSSGYLDYLYSYKEYINYHFFYMIFKDFFHVKHLNNIVLIELMVFIVLLIFYIQSQNLQQIKNGLFNNDKKEFFDYVIYQKKHLYRGFSFVFSLNVLNILLSTVIFSHIVLYGSLFQQVRFVLYPAYNDFAVESIKNIINRKNFTEIKDTLYNHDYNQLKDKLDHEYEVSGSKKNIFNIMESFLSINTDIVDHCNPEFMSFLNKGTDSDSFVKICYNFLYDYVVDIIQKESLSLTYDTTIFKNLLKNTEVSKSICDTMWSFFQNIVQKKIDYFDNNNNIVNGTTITKESHESAVYLIAELMLLRVANKTYKNDEHKTLFLDLMESNTKKMLNSNVYQNLKRIISGFHPMIKMSSDVFSYATMTLFKSFNNIDRINKLIFNQRSYLLTLILNVKLEDLCLVQLTEYLKLNVYQDTISKINKIIYEYQVNDLNKQDILKLINNVTDQFNIEKEGKKNLQQIFGFYTNEMHEDILETKDCKRLLNIMPRQNTKYIVEQYKKQLTDNKEQNIKIFNQLISELQGEFQEMGIKVPMTPIIAPLPFTELDFYTLIQRNTTPIWFVVKMIIFSVFSYIYRFCVPVIDETYEYIVINQTNKYINHVLSKIPMLRRSKNTQENINSIVGYGLHCDYFSYDRLYVGEDFKVTSHEVFVFNKIMSAHCGSLSKIIIGQSGSGKTTLFNMLFSMINLSDKSSLYFLLQDEEKNLFTMNYLDIHPQTIRKSISYVPQLVEIPDHFTIQDFLEYVVDDQINDCLSCLKKVIGDGPIFQKVKFNALNLEIVNIFFELLGLYNIDYDRKFYTLSGGQRRRVLLISALYKTVISYSYYSCIQENNLYNIGINRKARLILSIFKNISEINSDQYKKVKALYLNNIKNLQNQQTNQIDYFSKTSSTNISLLAIDELNAINPEIRRQLYQIIIHGTLQSLKNKVLYYDLQKNIKKYGRLLKKTINPLHQIKLKRKILVLSNRLQILSEKNLSFIMISHFYKEVFGADRFISKVQNNKLLDEYDEDDFIYYDANIQI